MNNLSIGGQEGQNARPRPRMRRHAAQATAPATAPAELNARTMTEVDVAAREVAVSEVDDASEELDDEYEYEDVAEVVSAGHDEEDEGDEDELDYEPGEFESAYEAVVDSGAEQAATEDTTDETAEDTTATSTDDASADESAEPEVVVPAAVAIPVQGSAADAADSADGWVDSADGAPASRRSVWTKVQFGLAALSATPLLFIGGLGGWPWQDEKAAVAAPSALPANYPVSVQVTRLGINAPTDALGVDPLTKVLQPPAIGRAGWYEAGPEPGEMGRAVMLGRRSPDGVDVFAKLDQVRSGDRIIVRTVDGTELTFLVTGVRTFDADEVPVDRIYGGSQQSAQLRMISSTGEFVASKGGYQRNVVVFANLKS